jgi:hypothetical protein
MPQIIWVQVGPQARIRDLKLFFGRSIELPILDKNFGHWPVIFHAHASTKVWNVPREFNILPSLFASLGSFGDSWYAACLLLVLRLACAAQLAWPGLVPRPSVLPPYRQNTLWQCLGPTSRLTVTMIGL